VKSKKLINLKIPRHIAFIMDGNGRWAKKRGLPRHVGHKYGADALKPVIKRCLEHGIETVSFFVFSTENWNRPQKEVDEIMRIMQEFIESSLKDFLEKDVRLIHSGNLDKVPASLATSLYDMIGKTAHCKTHTVNLCFNYGGRSEIVNAVNRILEQDVKVVTEKSFVNFLQHTDLSAPDIVVRTSGESRISNFMLWQMAYSELYFPKTHWPDMNAKIVDKIIKVYSKRDRRYGAIKG